MIKALTILVGAVLLAGCSLPPRTDELKPGQRVSNAYSGLSGQTIAVMVWADWATRTEYNEIQLHLAQAVQARLEARARPARERERAELNDVQFINPKSVVRFQRENPEFEGLPIETVASKLGASRVIHLEMEEFQTQSPLSIMILQGKASATLRIIEVAADRSTKVAYSEMSIKAEFPPNAPEGVAPSEQMNTRTIYAGTLHTLAEKVVARMEEKR